MVVETTMETSEETIEAMAEAVNISIVHIRPREIQVNVLDAMALSTTTTIVLIKTTYAGTASVMGTLVRHVLTPPQAAVRVALKGTPEPTPTVEGRSGLWLGPHLWP